MRMLFFHLLFSKPEREAIRDSLVHSWGHNAFGYEFDRSARGILKRFFPEAIVRRGIPTKYANSF